jgi:hypothetical protein
VPTAERMCELLGRLLAASHLLAPDDLDSLVSEEVVRAGFASTGIYLADYEDRELIPLHGGPPLSIDSTMAGLAYRTEHSVESAADGDDMRRLWLPLRDGVARVGVMHLDAEQFDDALVDHCAHLATLVTGLIVSKTQYGDGFVVARRRRPVSLATELRRGLLPPFSFATESLSLACALEPSYTVAGDAFDYALDGHTLHLAIFDAMGHDVDAARMANLAIAVYRHARRASLGLIETYGLIGDTIAVQCGLDAFVTGHLMTLDARTGALQSVNAGHPPPLLLRQAGIVGAVGAQPSPPFGMADEPERVEHVSLEPDDRLVLYTDGLVEARSADGQTFGVTRLVDVIVRAFWERHSGAEAVRRLMHAVLTHLDGPPQDDAAIVLLSWTRPE